MRKSKFFGKVATELERGRPKAIIKRERQLNLKLTDFEVEKISKIAEKLEITKTEAILRGIDLLIQHKPKKYGNVNEILKKHGVHFDDDNDD